MKIVTIKLRGFRNYTEAEINPHPGINLLFGQNGSGKTNMLQAIHFCALGRSHRTLQDREAVQKNGAQPTAAVGVTLEKNSGRHEIALRLAPDAQQKKQLFIDRKKAARMSDLMGMLQCVSFSPEDLMLVKDGPPIRRRFMDMTASQLSTACFTALQGYRKALEQRNAMLRDAKYGPPPDPAIMDVFEKTMADCSGVIIRERARLLQGLAEMAAQKYASISGREAQDFGMRYACCLRERGQEEEQVMKALAANRAEDIRRGTTTFGVHRQDIDLMLKGRDMKQFASQGQIRTAALAMKLAELEILRREAGEPPVLLLDDVMSELDMTRRTRLLQEIEGVQTFVTCTDETDLQACGSCRTYHVSLTPEACAEIRKTAEGPQTGNAMNEENDPDFS